MFGNAGTGTDAFVWAALLSFFDLGVWGVVYAYTPELYPTAVRATGAGSAAAVGRLGGIVGPYLPPLPVPRIGQGGLFRAFPGLPVPVPIAPFALAQGTNDP